MKESPFIRNATIETPEVAWIWSSAWRDDGSSSSSKTGRGVLLHSFARRIVFFLQFGYFTVDPVWIAYVALRVQPNVRYRCVDGLVRSTV
ncbi:putative transmembrane protein [Toxoplasma gondii TgCatPRC2]|uniref:Transmembrane protein n=10 Tax=Toxoplasma gondii TaxID=5811 RepID=A0A125YIE9_TOXGV|nr:hypothetical protein TGME49_294225 [Toxoplasma gondii ME49]EPR57582.1 hypothetical protein TGGT1_294225 [Toxoplasma gondii GT1]ESS29297.1 putative transmembrane protein [Toxoplasma gondii VEG]KFG35615.1 putative transmembrane protein [Toxoplasma gondii p89]KFH14331.1 putative transmembrane protein [Toxoplasma gondii MAS]KYF39744.1 hypothetical protein TGARI_294225 [Toxoplasma gondii ARI]KYK65900.1 putative transmembrane protein [Toxoplasma gondii TgCatPRC2]PIL97749.1 putative transmembran|eukprot:XP_018638601.1 hypothetical protein TGME49_294225 [Toxoplasma gondii ME49]